jgi:transcription elongation factor GreA
MSNDIETTWLTQEAHDRLQAELETLSGPGRAEIVGRIEAAREEGDLKENGGYHAAKDEQGKIEARIRQLTELLRTSTVGEATDDGTVEPGTVVTATIAGDASTFLVGNREIVAEGSDLQVYSPSSPIGAAIMGLKAGASTTYEAPNGKEITVVVEDVKRYQP